MAKEKLRQIIKFLADNLKISGVRDVAQGSDLA